jgi:hypothetical protein
MSIRPPLPQLGRRDLIRNGILAGARTLVPWGSASADLPRIPRNRTMIVAWSGREGRWADWDLWNPYSVGSDHQN